jgi:hypothetical protein
MYPIEVRAHMQQIRYGILDTNALLNNIAGDVRTYPRPTGIRLLSTLGALRPLVGLHVVAEVEERIDAYMLQRRLDVAFARWIWEREYLPRLWVVDTDHLGSQDTRVARLADDHPHSPAGDPAGSERCRRILT